MNREEITHNIRTRIAREVSMRGVNDDTMDGIDVNILINKVQASIQFLSLIDKKDQLMTLSVFLLELYEYKLKKKYCE